MIKLASLPFFEQPHVERSVIPVGSGVTLGVARVSHPALGLGGAYGAWGESYDNLTLPRFVADRLGSELPPEDRMNLESLGFTYRHHVLGLSHEQHLDLEVAVGARFLEEAARACGWRPDEVDAVLIGMSGPVADDYTERIARAAGIPESALKLSVHKACDSSMGSLHLALNPDLPEQALLGANLGLELRGKKVLVGGIEGLSRFVQDSHDVSALQLFGNGAGVLGLIPGENMRYLVGSTRQTFDTKGVLAVSMHYPHSGRADQAGSLLEVSRAGDNHYRVAGLMHEPEDGASIEMAGPMGMVKLFVRSGVEVVQEAYAAYQSKLNDLGMTGKKLAVTIAHHANLKINRLKEKHLSNEGIRLSMPWLLNDFGNVSAASNVIAFLRQLPSLKPGDHVLFDGFGAGTYYDVFAVSLSDG